VRLDFKVDDSIPKEVDSDFRGLYRALLNLVKKMRLRHRTMIRQIPLSGSMFETWMRTPIKLSSKTTEWVWPTR